MRQNVDAEAWLRKSENRRHYKQGRADTEARLGFAATQRAFEHLLFPARSSKSLPQEMDWGAAPEHPYQAFNNALQDQQSRHKGDAVFRSETAITPSPPAELSANTGRIKATTLMRASEALATYIAHDLAQAGKADARSIVALIVQFIIDMMDDSVLAEVNGAMVRQIDEMMPDIPDRQNIPREECASLASRYRYAQKHGWEGLKRLTEARLQDGYHQALSRFFSWAIDEGHYPYPKPVFRKTSPENLVSIQRDAFNPTEVRTIFSQAIFTGCKSADWIWTPGGCFLQNHLYWGYVLSFLTGMRAGELGQIELDDIEKADDHQLQVCPDGSCWTCG